jgi:putative transposase
MYGTPADGIDTARRACGPPGGPVAKVMKKISYSGYRFPPEIVQQAIWLYLRFTLSFRDVEDLLAERGIAVSYETVRRWVNYFGPMIAADLRKRRQRPSTIWHLDEVYLKIAGRMVYLWRAVDSEGEGLDVLVQSKRSKHAALKLMRKLLKKYGFVPNRMITDDLRSYGAAARDLGIESRQERGRWKNNRAENSHQPTRKGAQDAALQEPRLRPEIPLNPRRRLQHLQRPAPSRLCPNAPHLPRRGDEYVARGGRGCLKSRELCSLLALSSAT